VGGFAEEFRMNEDIDLYLRLCDRARFGFLDEPLTEREAGDNWPVAKSYEYRALALRRYLRRCKKRQRPLARFALASELKALGGYFRRRGNLAGAGYAYLRACLARVVV
jgi:hypothetical protein